MKALIREAGPTWAIVIHGFTRSARHLQGVADALAEHGISTIRPELGSLNWFRSVNNDRYLDHVAQFLREYTPPGAVIVGHSAGAAAGAYLAPALESCAGLVMVDGVDNPTHHIHQSWPVISQMPVIAICAPPNPCNRHGLLARHLREWGFSGLGGVVRGSGHGDIEDGEPPVYRVVCRSRSTPVTKELVRELVVWSVGDILGVPGPGANPWHDPMIDRWDERS
jgi:pimeloyl-ACP methyl ester carboxylesterase